MAGDGVAGAGVEGAAEVVWGDAELAGEVDEREAGIGGEGLPGGVDQGSAGPDGGRAAGCDSDGVHLGQRGGGQG